MALLLPILACSGGGPGILVLIRVVAILTALPVFNSRNLPVMVKVGLALAVALVLVAVFLVPGSLFSSDRVRTVEFTAERALFDQHEEAVREAIATVR